MGGLGVGGGSWAGKGAEGRVMLPSPALHLQRGFVSLPHGSFAWKCEMKVNLEVC